MPAAMEKTRNRSGLSFWEKSLSVPISLGAIALGLLEFVHDGYVWARLLPFCIGCQNLILLSYRKYPQSKRLAVILGIVCGLLTLLCLGRISI